MKVTLLCNSDTVGGAAVVTFRLMNALRAKGVDARMLVAKKSSDSKWVEQIPQNKHKGNFIAERGLIFATNGLNRKTLFQIDPAWCGTNVASNSLIQEADVIVLNWVNQGFLSIKDIKELSSLGKPIVWTMHDMWNMTGICHHAGYCTQFLAPIGECLNCPLLCSPFAFHPLANSVWKSKQKLYSASNIHFVAVSSWLAEKARSSSLMQNVPLSVIPNAFPIGDIIDDEIPISAFSEPFKILFGAARIDDPIKGHTTLVEAMKILKSDFSDVAEKIELITFGNLKDPSALTEIPVKHTHLGRIPPSQIMDLYKKSHIVLSTSEWETLPGTLIEGQAWGCYPIALDHGGQRDIITHPETGWLAEFHTTQKHGTVSPDISANARAIAEGISKSFSFLSDPQNLAATRRRMRKSVIEKFSESEVADRYIKLFNSLISL